MKKKGGAGRLGSKAKSGAPDMGDVCGEVRILKGHNKQLVVIWVRFFQNELMVDIYSKSLVAAIGKVLLMKFS